MAFLQNIKEVVQSNKRNNPVLLKVKKFFVCFALNVSNKNRVMSLLREWKSVF